MRKITLIFLLLFSISNVSAIAVVKQSKPDAKAETAIRQVMSEQAAAWNRGDIEGFMAGYWRSPDLVFVSGVNVTRGWQPTLDRYRKSYDSKEKMGILEFSDLEVTVLSKNSALVLGRWNLQRKTDNPNGRFTLIFRKFNEGWRVIHDHTS